MSRKREPTWVPTAGDYQQVFAEQNPWHLDGKVPVGWAKPVERPLAPLLARRLQTNDPPRFQLILGPRCVGKTTSMYQAVKHLLAGDVPQRRIWWLRLDHPLLMPVRLDELVSYGLRISRASEQEPAFFFLDELAYAGDWDLWLKTFYDEHWPLRLAASSSSTAVLKDRRLESGIGRWEQQYLAPYLFTEFLALTNRRVALPIADTLASTITQCVDAGVNLSNLSDLRRRFLFTGGFPELLMSHERVDDDEATVLLHSQRTLRSDAIERAIYKDIPQAFGVDNPMMLERVLYTLAGQVTGILSPSTISRSLEGLTNPTFDRYLSHMQQAFLVFTLPNYSGSEESKQRRGRKLFFVDGAVRNAALQRGIAPLSDHREMGLLVENLVAGQLHALSRQSQVRIYYWRDRRYEVDLVYDHPQAPVAFEVTLSGPHKKEGLHEFMNRFPRYAGKCYLVSPTAAPTHPEDNWDKVGTLPLDLLLLAIGGQAQEHLARRLSASARPT